MCPASLRRLHLWPSQFLGQRFDPSVGQEAVWTPRVSAQDLSCNRGLSERGRQETNCKDRGARDSITDGKNLSPGLFSLPHSFQSQTHKKYFTFLFTLIPQNNNENAMKWQLAFNLGERVDEAGRILKTCRFLTPAWEGFSQGLGTMTLPFKKRNWKFRFLKF